MDVERRTSPSFQDLPVGNRNIRKTWLPTNHIMAQVSMKTMAGYQRICVKYKEPARVQSSGRSSEVGHVESAITMVSLTSTIKPIQ